MISTDKLNWYAAYTRVNQELVIKKKLDELGVENYLPQEERVRETPLGRKKIRVILIHGLIFIRTDKTTSFSLLNDHLLNIVYLKDIEGRHSLIVPDKQMQDFMFVMDLNPEGVCFDNEPLTVGKKVTVVKGEFSGIEGEIATEANKTYVVIRITGVLVASIKVPKSYLKAIND